jgi:hypothetical protein
MVTHFATVRNTPWLQVVLIRHVRGAAIGTLSVICVTFLKELYLE